ncbi:hypothetical protein FRB90_007536 [Tulasnella sp. 427]|nr:hypothetical protein FRB90_007536 [Tulasnella sp. 427]
MRLSNFFILAASLLSVSASALVQRQNPIPSCATSCLTSSDPSPCAETDVLCLCVNPTYVNATTACVKSSCSTEDAASAQTASEALCKAAGIDPKNPFPSCAQTCLDKADPGSCSLSDYSCLCRDTNYLLSAHGVDITQNAATHSSAAATGVATSPTSVGGSTASSTITTTASPSATKNAGSSAMALANGYVVGGLAAFFAAFGFGV